VTVIGEEFDITGRAGRLHAQRFGSASAPLVLGLPGLSGNVKNFDYLGERIGGDALQLVALDWRGRGKSEQTPSGTYGWENHALDALAVADALGFEDFRVIGQSMGGSIAMKMAELDAPRLNAVVLVDVAGRVDPGVGNVIGASIARLGRVHGSVEEYLQIVRSQGLVEPWTDYWDRAHRYELEELDGGVRTRTSLDAVAEDRAYTMTQDPYRRWKYLTMPTLLVRANQELRPGCGYVVPANDRDAFLRAVPSAAVVEIDANHLSVNTHPDTVTAIRRFLSTAG
jgi:pimeloyl-ACP methyl ester carboxylesterase